MSLYWQQQRGILETFLKMDNKYKQWTDYGFVFLFFLQGLNNLHDQRLKQTREFFYSQSQPTMTWIIDKK